MKTLTRKQLESSTETAERFMLDVLSDPERSDEIANESLEDSKVKAKNKYRGRESTMARGSFYADKRTA